MSIGQFLVDYRDRRPLQLKDIKFDQLQGVVNEALEEGGVKMGTIMQELLDRGKEIGKKEGVEQKQLKIALNCIMKGMDNRTISELTELDIEQIESLKAAIKNKTA